MKITDRFTKAWNAFRFTETDRYRDELKDRGAIYTTQPIPYQSVPTARLSTKFINTIFNRIALDCSQVDIRHVRSDPETKNETPIESHLQYVLSVEANIDQTHKELIHDIVYSLLSESAIAVVPIDTSRNPTDGSFDIYSLRVARIMQWGPQHVVVRAYDERDGKLKDITMRKRDVAIIENPLYDVTSNNNDTLRRLIAKLNILDASDEYASVNKLDLIIQLPYAIKNPTKRKEADERLQEIERQLSNGKRGITYLDATEKVTQLNRPVASGLLEEINSLRDELYNQIGITKNVFDGTASEAEMRNYYARTIDAILNRIVTEFRRKFLTKTAITQGQTISYHRDPFKLVPVEQVAEIVDKFKRNEVVTSNEIRPILGFAPSPDPRANSLRNPNIAKRNQQVVDSAPMTLSDKLVELQTLGLVSPPDNSK